MTADQIRVQLFDGAAGVTLAAGELSATFVPELGMLGGSLRWGDHEYLSLHGGLITWMQGHTTGLPLLYPWANRLSGHTFDALGAEVDLAEGAGVHLDGAGLPIHGTMIARKGWTILELDHHAAGPSLWARFRFADHSDLLATFPFPHNLDLRISVGHDASGNPRLIVRTLVIPLAGVEVPVSFGWHPYFTLPGVDRDAMELWLPARHHLLLDEEGIPTGGEVAEPGEALSLADRTFDDHYRLDPGGRAPVFVLAGGAHRLTITLNGGYSHAQIYAPERKPFVAIEPMTAAIDALRAGTYGVATNQAPFEATFTVTLG